MGFSLNTQLCTDEHGHVWKLRAKERTQEGSRATVLGAHAGPQTICVPTARVGESCDTQIVHSQGIASVVGQIEGALILGASLPSQWDAA